jgi:hypothetical protein
MVTTLIFPNKESLDIEVGDVVKHFCPYPPNGIAFYYAIKDLEFEVLELLPQPQHNRVMMKVYNLEKDWEFITVTKCWMKSKK